MKMPILYDLAIPLLGINSRETILSQEAFMKMLKAALRLLETRNQPMAIDSKTNKMWAMGHKLLLSRSKL